MKIFFILFPIFHIGGSVIYRLNDTMYYKMPPLNHIDDYVPCLSEPDAVYCTTKLELVSDTPSHLLNMIRNFSEHRPRHYNHSRLRYGVCVTKSCRYLDHDGTKRDLERVLEVCFNDTFQKKYNLKTKVMELYCNIKEDNIDVDYADYVVAAIIFALLLFNAIGSVYDILFVQNGEKGNKLLLMFSIKRNWAKLTAPFNMSDPRAKRLKSFNGLRTITTALVIVAHSTLPFIHATSNPRNIEHIYDNVLYHTFINGTPIVQVFFIMSGFLLAFNIQLNSEKNKLSWRMISKGIVLRWLRLTPVYATVLAVGSTWLPISGSGPYWHEAVVSEAQECRKDFWQNLLYINNYFDSTRCMPQTWYLAADFQLYCIGMMICVLLNNAQRKVVIPLLFAAGVVILGVVTYSMDLDAVLIVSPETALHDFVRDPTFNNIYKRGHTNLAGYVIGLSAGYIAYHLLTNGFTIEKYKKYSWIYQFLFPTDLLIVWMGIIFYQDGPQYPLYFRALYGAIVKPIFTVIIALYVLGLIFKCDDINRSVLEWPGWAATGRLSYAAYILHIPILRTFIGMTETLTTSYFLDMVKSCIANIVLTFIVATPLWLLVESPMLQLVKHIFVPPAEIQEKKKTIEQLKITQNSK